MGRTKAYDLARRDQFPCRVIRIGETYRVPTAGLLELLGVTAEASHGTGRPGPTAYVTRTFGPARHWRGGIAWVA